MEPYCSWRANILLMSKWFNTCVFFLKTSGRIRHLRHLCAFFGGFKTCKTGSHVDGIEYRFNFPACKVQIGRCWKGCISMPLYKFQGELGYKEPELTMFDKANLILHQLHPWFHDENTWAKNHITILKLTEFKSFFENSFPNTHTHTHPSRMGGGFGILSTLRRVFWDRRFVFGIPKKLFLWSKSKLPNLGEWWWLSISHTIPNIDNFFVCL